MTSEEEKCLKHFENNYSFANDEKFVVKLPLKIDRSELVLTRNRAQAALSQVEKRLKEKSKKLYVDFMKESRNLGHMSVVRNDSLGN